MLLRRHTLETINKRKNGNRAIPKDLFIPANYSGNFFLIITMQVTLTLAILLMKHIFKNFISPGFLKYIRQHTSPISDSNKNRKSQKRRFN
jgi:hypothetical protein